MEQRDPSQAPRERDEASEPASSETESGASAAHRRDSETERDSDPSPSADPDRPDLLDLGFGASPDGESSFVTAGLVFYGALAVAAVVWRMGFYDEPICCAPGAETSDWLQTFDRDLLIGLAAGGLVILASDWMTRGTEWGELLARSMAAALGRLSVPDALLLAVASGIAEEMFFRGALQPRAGLLLASLLFGCVHFVPRREFLPWTGFALLAGLLFGSLFEWTGNLTAPIVAHILVNGVNLPALVRRYGPDAAGDELPEDGEAPGS